jgi:hypothetical protein
MKTMRFLCRSIDTRPGRCTNRVQRSSLSGGRVLSAVCASRGHVPKVSTRTLAHLADESPLRHASASEDGARDSHDVAAIVLRLESNPVPRVSVKGCFAEASATHRCPRHHTLKRPDDVLVSLNLLAERAARHCWRKTCAGWRDQPRKISDGLTHCNSGAVKSINTTSMLGSVGIITAQESVQQRMVG